MSDAVTAALTDFGKARASREETVEAGAQIMFEQIPQQDGLQTLYLVLSDDAPVEVQMIFFAPKGLTEVAWEALMSTAGKRWYEMEAAYLKDETMSGYEPAYVLAFKKGLEALVLHIATLLGLDVRAVHQNAWLQAAWPL